MQKHTILFLAANPGGTDRLALDREARAIQVELERSGYRDCFELETRWAAEPLDLLRELRKLKPTVVHFSGHGGPARASEHQPAQTPRRDVVDGKPDLHGGALQPGLLFHGADGRAQVASTEALEKTIAAAGSSVKLVVLSACYSEAHASALLAHVDCVVGMSGSIDDDAARSFAIGFYGGMGERASVEAAYKQGCAAISLEGLRDADRPQLRVRDGVDADKLVLAGAPLASATVAGLAASSARRPKVDIGILTIREDEFRAVLGVFSEQVGIINGAHREYTLRRAEAGNGEHYTVAVLRQVEQGNGEAQDAARDLIEDLAPKLVLVVGIAGGLPSDDVKLGDVILSTRIHDFTVEARRIGKDPTYAAAGGPITKALAARITNLASREAELGDWTTELPPQPAVSWTAGGELYGTEPWQRELRDKLARHYGEGATPRAPVYVAGAIASSDRLVKDPALLFPWITTARNILAVEMESGGVYRASRERCPMLAIRAISDIVGLKRSAPWTKFACAAAAAFTRAFLRTRPVPVGSLDVVEAPLDTGAEVTGPQKPSGPSWRRRVLLVTAALSALLTTTLILSAGARLTACRVPGVRSLCAAVGIGEVTTCQIEERLEPEQEVRRRLISRRSARKATETEARADAVAMGQEEAPKICNELAEGGTVLVLPAFRVEPLHWMCDPNGGGVMCFFEGEVVCRVQNRIKSEQCR